MDGVLADFNKEYTKYDPNSEDRKKFRSSVLDHHIFEKLDFMPDTQKLLDHVAKLQNINIEILTSMGTHDPFQAFEAKKQKLKWLNDHNIPYKANFVHSKQEKANYAGSTSILIDDSIGCINPYIAAGGHGILHKNATDTIKELNSILMSMHTIEILNNE
jgi:hypothetical protein